MQEHLIAPAMNVAPQLPARPQLKLKTTPPISSSFLLQAQHRTGQSPYGYGRARGTDRYNITRTFSNVISPPPIISSSFGKICSMRSENSTDSSTIGKS